MSDDQKLHDVHRALSNLLSKVQDCWATRMLVTLVVRDPNNTENELVIGDDSMDEAIAAIERARTRPAIEGNS